MIAGSALWNALQKELYEATATAKKIIDSHGIVKQVRNAIID